MTRAQTVGPDEIWPGFFLMDNGLLRRKLDPAEGFRSRNWYYRETNCTRCGVLMLQNTSNGRCSRPFCSTVCKSATVKFETDKRDTLYRKPCPNGGFHTKRKRRHHPRADRQGTVFEHVLVAEQKLGRALCDGEVVHHIDCIKNNNHPDNLTVCASHTEHFLIHGSLNRCVASLIASGALTFNHKTRVYEVAL